MTTYLVITESAWEGPQEYPAQSWDQACEIADYLRARQYRVRIKELDTNHLELFSATVGNQSLR